MVCNSCGSEYDEKLLQCPYCGSENEVLARKKQREYIATYEKKINELGSVPKEMAKSAANKVVKIVTVLVALFLVMAGIVWLITRQQASKALDKQQRQLAKLEEYYQAGNYAEIGGYLDEIEGYGSSYEKYRQIEQVYYRYEDIQESVKSDIEMLEQYGLSMAEEDLAANYVVWELEECFRQLQRIRKIEEEDFPYGNDEGICDIREKYIEILKTKLFLTAEEIEEGTVRYVDSDTDYMDLAKLSAKRLVGEFEKNGRDAVDEIKKNGRDAVGEIEKESK